MFFLSFPTLGNDCSIQSGGEFVSWLNWNTNSSSHPSRTICSLVCCYPAAALYQIPMNFLPSCGFPAFTEDFHANQSPICCWNSFSAVAQFTRKTSMLTSQPQNAAVLFPSD